MKVLIKGVSIIDRNSPHHGTQVDVLVERGKLHVNPGKSAKADKTIEAKGMYLTPGWCDMRCWLGDPGFEHKEDIQTGLDAAMAGGFTAVALLPNNDPVTQSKNDIKYLKGANHDLVEVLPLAAVTRGTKGEELTEMIDLHTAGAAGFTDGLASIWHSDILMKCLQYLQKFDGLLINKAEDMYLTRFGVMHEGKQSTMLGMKGIPGLAEELMVMRDLELLKYAGGRLHFTTISTGRTLAMIRAARKEGLDITCDMAAYQTMFTDEDLVSFDTYLKVQPPFRENTDRKALIRGLKDDTIDVICSNHIPQDTESKILEFDLAEFGMISLQTVASNLVSLSEEVPMEKLLDKVSIRPREILKTDIPVIKTDEIANITLFDPAATWTLNDDTNLSKSVNSPFWDKPLTGQVKLVMKGSRYHFNG
jgi:dihydroorotase